MSKKGKPGCIAQLLGGIVLVVLLVWGLKSCGEDGPPAAAPAGIEHRFQRARHGGRSQIRAIIEPGKYTEAEARDLAVQLCRADGDGLYLVKFFANPIVLQGWDGTGTAPERDQPHWLGRVPVEIANGQGYAAKWWTAPEAITGRSEAEVLRARGGP